MKPIHTKHLATLALLFVVFLLNAQNLATINSKVVKINNGVIEVSIDGGRVTELSIIGESNLLANGGAGSFSMYDMDGYFSPSRLKPLVKINNSEIADIYFTHSANYNLEMHYVFRKNESGFYTYMVISDNNVLGGMLEEARFWLRIDKERFNYAWNAEREGPVVHPDELKYALEKVQDATYLLQDSSIYTKYDWSAYRLQDSLHGFAGEGYGIWSIEASREYINGGPSSQDLTCEISTTTPVLLTYYNSCHYGNAKIDLTEEYESWQKIYGPSFMYINTGDTTQVISDAQLKTSELIAQWPYEWMDNELYPQERGTLTGKLKIQGNGDVDSALVFLSKSRPHWFEEELDWQKHPYGYFFWTEADSEGNFSIDNIRPGNYVLRAFTQKGIVINDLAKENIEIETGSNNIGIINWQAGSGQKTIFQLGIANHKSSEYKLADLPRLYGRWKDCPLNLTYNIDTSSYSDDWYYCQRVNGDWNVQFQIDDTSKLVNPSAKVAIAGCDQGPHLDVIINGTTVSVNDLGTDSGIARSSLSGGKYHLISFTFEKHLLAEGLNTMTLRCYGSPHEYKGIVYDAIVLEADTAIRSKNADLDSLKISTGTLSPEFVSNITKYKVELPRDIVNIPTTSAFLADSNATIEIRDIDKIPGIATVEVYAEDGNTHRTYEIYFNYEGSSNVNLSSLSTNLGTLNPAFSPDTYNYHVLLPNGTTDIPELSANAASEFATLEIFNITRVPDIARIQVIAEDGISKKSYEVQFEIEAAAIDANQTARLTVYPNPATNQIRISAKDIITEVQLLDITGKTLLNSDRFNQNDVLFKFPMQEQGVYLLQIKTSTEIIHKKIILRSF